MKKFGASLISVTKYALQIRNWPVLFLVCIFPVIQKIIRPDPDGFLESNYLIELRSLSRADKLHEIFPIPVFHNRLGKFYNLF